MKRSNMLYATLIALAVSACGGTSSTPAPETKSIELVQSRVMDASTPSDGSIVIAGYRGNYTISKAQDTGIVTLTNRVTGAVTTYLNPPLIKFVDKYTSFDITGPAGQVYRLYQAAFNRKPDLPGLGFWINATENGHTIQSIASEFLISSEFKTLYGDNASADVFITAMYANVLHRAADPAGYQWWVNAVMGGADRGGVVVGFSESAENQSNVNPGLMNGFDYIPFNPGGPIIPQASSYVNKITAATVLGPQTMPPEVTESNTVAFADFFQDGTYSMVTHSLEYNYSAANANEFGHIKFYKNVNGVWVDNTSKLLTNTVGCLHPRKAIVADFNGDGKPDVFFACHGLDVAPYPGEHPHVLMSQPDGTYANITLPEICYCHSASAADATGHGFADILVTDNMISHTPFFYTNHNGALIKDTSRFGQILSQPNDGSVGYPGVSYGSPAIYTAELIDFYGTGRYDAFLAGTAPDNVWGNWAPSIFKNDGSGIYTQANSVKLPYDKYYESTLDIVFENGIVYLTSVHENNGQGSTYGFSNIAKIDLSKMNYTQIYSNNTNFANGHGWLNWIIPYKGNIVSQSAAYAVSVSQ